MAARQGRTAKKDGAAKKPRKPRVVKPVLRSEHPLEYLCAISHRLMMDPVIALDGSSYERWCGHTRDAHAGTDMQPHTETFYSDPPFTSRAGWWSGGLRTRRPRACRPRRP